MINFLKITLFSAAICLVYSLVGNWVPQKKIYPPESKEITDDMTTDDLVEIGESIYTGKGTCLSCHAMARFPNLGSIGSIAGSRKEGMTDAEYLAESMYDPGAYIVEGFNPGMPPIHRPPIALSDKEILAVIAYLQTLGGEATVTLETKFKWQSAEGAAPAAAAPVAASAPAKTRTVEELMTKYTCAACHSMNDATKTAGPSLFNVGSRMTTAEIYESLVNPDATITKGFAPVMGATLAGLGFNKDVTAAELKLLVDHLAAKKGGK